MKVIGTLVSFVLMVILAAAAVLGLGWLIAVVVRGMWGVDPFQSLVLAFAVLGILVLFANAAALKSIAGLSDLIHEAIGADEADDEAEEEEGTWFSPCPCGRGRPFARCCGKRAFRRRQSAGPE